MLVMVLSLTMVSCYTSRVHTGTITEDTPKIQVNSKKNHFLFWGLLPLDNSQQATQYIMGKKDYTVQTSWTFVDGLLNCLTLGIYNPTTTTYYLPVDDIK